MFKDTIKFIKDLYPNKDFISLHEPIFNGNEKKYVLDAIDSTFVSSVGQYVNDFEKKIANYIKADFAIVTGNGTSAMHAALHLINVGPNDEVITQALTFVATANAIKYCHAEPIFIDSDPHNLGMSVSSLQYFLSENTEMIDGSCFNKKTKRKIKACVPVHIFGHPVEIEKIIKVCDQYNIVVIEDAAESLGSLVNNTHTGLFGLMGVFSFNGNKILTSGGGGVIVTNNEQLAKRAKHITTTAKVPHKWNFYHDELGFNYRMPNLNAALACAQLEQLDSFIANKRETALSYQNHFSKKGIRFVTEPINTRSNYWLNAIMLNNRIERDLFLEETNSQNVMTRPVWQLMPDLPMYESCQTSNLDQARYIVDRLVNIPSGVRVL